MASPVSAPASRGCHFDRAPSAAPVGLTFWHRDPQPPAEKTKTFKAHWGAGAIGTLLVWSAPVARRARKLGSRAAPTVRGTDVRTTAHGVEVPRSEDR